MDSLVAKRASDADPASHRGRPDPLAAGVAVLVIAALLVCAGLVLIASG